MTFTDKRYQDALGQMRMLLTLLRTPKLRGQLATILSDDEGRGLPAGPFSRLSWLDADGRVDQDSLKTQTALIDGIMADDALLDVGRIREMPQGEEARVALLNRIIRRVFETHTGHDWMSGDELNARLSILVEDVPGMRRAAVDYGVLRRADDGSRYWLA